MGWGISGKSLITHQKKVVFLVDNLQCAMFMQFASSKPHDHAHSKAIGHYEYNFLLTKERNGEKI